MSTKVIEYEGQVTVRGEVADFEKIIDPQTWSQHYPFIWLESFLIDGQLPFDRDTVPPTRGNVETNPRGGLLFEQVLFGPIIYSNVIATQLDLRSPNELRFDYSEIDCRTTEFLGEITDGGIDVDTGAAVCVSAADAGFVTIKLTKAVRFTEPSPLVELAEPLFEAVVKTTLDALLHSLIFVGP